MLAIKDDFAWYIDIVRSLSEMCLCMHNTRNRLIGLWIQSHWHIPYIFHAKFNCLESLDPCSLLFVTLLLLLMSLLVHLMNGIVVGDVFQKELCHTISLVIECTFSSITNTAVILKFQTNFSPFCPVSLKFSSLSLCVCVRCSPLRFFTRCNHFIAAISLPHFNRHFPHFCFVFPCWSSLFFFSLADVPVATTQIQYPLHYKLSEGFLSKECSDLVSNERSLLLCHAFASNAPQCKVWHFSFGAPATTKKTSVHSKVVKLGTLPVKFS